MTPLYAYSFVEDSPSSEALKKIIDYSNNTRRQPIVLKPGFPKVMGGYGKIKKDARNFVNMAYANILNISLVDLDNEVCAPHLVEKWFNCLPEKLPKSLIFRIAVREIESWLMADLYEFSKFFQIPKDNFSKSPDELGTPKKYLLTTIRKKGKKKWHREMLPEGSAHIGPRYNEKLNHFIVKQWKPERAAENSPSLASAIAAIENF